MMRVLGDTNPVREKIIFYYDHVEDLKIVSIVWSRMLVDIHYFEIEMVDSITEYLIGEY